MSKHHVLLRMFKIRQHPKFMLIFCTICIIASVAFSIHLTYASSYEIKQAELMVEVGDELSLKVEDYIEASEAVLKDIKLDTTNVNTNRVGNYKIKVSYQDELSTIKVNVMDTTAPIFLGVEDTTILLHSEFDPISLVSAYDIGSGDVSDQIEVDGTVDVDHVGTYEVVYHVSDHEGNQAEKKRVITVSDEMSSSAATNASDTKRQKMLDAVLNYLGDDVNAVGLIYYDLSSGNSFSINGAIQFRSASTIKVPIVMALYAAADAGELSLDEIMYYQASTDYEGGTGILQNQDLTQGYTLSELAEYAITYSDNIAFHMIWRRLGTDTCLTYYENLIGHDTNWETTEMSATDGLAVMKTLNSLTTENMNKLKQDLMNTVFDDRISKSLPNNITAHKIGDYGSYIHDYGIIFDEHPYVLAVYTNGLSDAKTKIAEISKIIYQLHTK